MWWHWQPSSPDVLWRSSHRWTCRWRRWPHHWTSWSWIWRWWEHPHRRARCKWSSCFTAACVLTLAYFVKLIKNLWENPQSKVVNIYRTFTTATQVLHVYFSHSNTDHFYQVDKQLVRTALQAKQSTQTNKDGKEEQSQMLKFMPQYQKAAFSGGMERTFTQDSRV